MILRFISLHILVWKDPWSYQVFEIDVNYVYLLLNVKFSSFIINIYCLNRRNNPLLLLLQNFRVSIFIQRYFTILNIKLLLRFWNLIQNSCIPRHLIGRRYFCRVMESIWSKNRVWNSNRWLRGSLSRLKRIYISDWRVLLSYWQEEVSFLFLNQAIVLNNILILQQRI